MRNGPDPAWIGTVSSRGFFFRWLRGIGRDEHESCRLNQLEPHQQDRIIVRSDTVWIFLVAPKAAVNDHLLPVPAGEQPGRLHQCMAVAPAVAGVVLVDVPRVEAVWAMVTMPPATDRRPDELPAMSAFERLVRVASRRTGEPVSLPAIIDVPGALPPSPASLASMEIVTGREVVECLPVCVV